FESYAAGSVPGGAWTPSMAGGAALVVDATKPYRGKKSLHVTAPMGGPAHALLSQAKGKAVPIAGNNLFGRVMLFFADPAPSGTHFNIFEAGGVSPVSGDVIFHWGGKGDGRTASSYFF